ncbi:MAG: hypothetical protein COB85_08340 [Bacteroidetes bacterium]|nr:MAG: hypothetical protein COB85_08340 [Bacteroidota bacterium]
MNKLALLLCLLFIVIVSSCKKEGCTDESAINYDIVANKDDGSCEYCIPAEEGRGSLTFYLIDDIFNSQYYNEQILRIDITGVRRVYSDASCGVLTCYADFTITNLIANNISYIDFWLSIYPSIGGSWYYDHTTNSGASIPEGGQITINDVPASSSCGSLDFASVNDYLYTVSYN